MRDLDTAFNYAAFSSHGRLAATAADLLPEFHLSTKVGFFPAPAPAGPDRPASAAHGREHSLAPDRLRAAIAATAEELGRVPDVVFLHNPERSLRLAGGPEHGRDLLLAAAAALSDAARTGLCGAWGVSTWDAQPLVEALRTADAGALPRPGHLMHRVGVLVGPDALTSADTLARLLGVPAAGRWGMSPFGGDAQAPFWADLRVTTLLGNPPPAGVGIAPAAFRLAYELPPVTRVAVSTNDPGHLAELVEAARLDVDHTRVQRYRTLLAGRQRLVDAS